MSEQILPEEYLKLREIDNDRIDRVKIIPPKLGGDDFGKIEVTYKTSIYKLPEGW